MNQPREESTKSSKNMWFIVVAVIMTVIVVDGEIYWWRQSVIEAAKETEVQWRKLRGVFVYWTLEYPNGWHVADDGGLKGRIRVMFNPEPISQVGRGGLGALIALVDIFEDPFDRHVSYPKFTDVLDEVRKGFEDLKEENFINKGGVKIYKFTGKRELWGVITPDIVYYLEYKVGIDPHIVLAEVDSHAVSEVQRQAAFPILEHMMKTFEVSGFID